MHCSSGSRSTTRGSDRRHDRQRWREVRSNEREANSLPSTMTSTSGAMGTKAQHSHAGDVQATCCCCHKQINTNVRNGVRLAGKPCCWQAAKHTAKGAECNIKEGAGETRAASRSVVREQHKRHQRQDEEWIAHPADAAKVAQRKHLYTHHQHEHDGVSCEAGRASTQTWPKSEPRSRPSIRHGIQAARGKQAESALRRVRGSHVNGVARPPARRANHVALHRTKQHDERTRCKHRVERNAMATAKR